MSAKSNRLKQRNSQLAKQLDKQRQLYVQACNQHTALVHRHAGAVGELRSCLAKLHDLGHATWDDETGGLRVQMAVIVNDAKRLTKEQWASLAVHMVQEIQKELGK